MSNTSQPSLPGDKVAPPRPDLPFDDPYWMLYINAKGDAWAQQSPTAQEVFSLTKTVADAMAFQRHQYEKTAEMAALLKQAIDGENYLSPVGVSSHDPSIFFPGHL